MKWTTPDSISKDDTGVPDQLRRNALELGAKLETYVGQIFRIEQGGKYTYAVEFPGRTNENSLRVLFSLADFEKLTLPDVDKLIEYAKMQTGAFSEQADSYF